MNYKTKEEMSFIPTLRTFINQNNIIYSVRRYLYKNNRCYVAGVGWCKRELIFKIEEKI